jgi:hypothetical protein
VFVVLLFHDYYPEYALAFLRPSIYALAMASRLNSDATMLILISKLM